MEKIKYFSLGEMLASATARRLNIDNTPTWNIVDNLNRLCKYLDSVREKVGMPLIINSGYRCALLNKAVGGVTNSQHTQGLAADIVCADMDKLITVISETLDFDQLITEHTKGSTSYWVHVSIPKVNIKPRRQVILNLTKK